MSEEEKDLGGSMEAIDPEEYKKMLQQPKEPDHNDLEDFVTPIEVKSTRHLQIQQEQLDREQAKVDAVKNAHAAANEVFDWFESLIMAVVFIVILFTFFVRVNTVEGTSMDPTLKEGQKLVVTDLFYTPSYNDIVIIQAAKLDGGKPIVKRIIGLPGDKIKIDFEAGLVYRNGEQLPVETKGGYIYEDGHKINSYTTRNLEMISGEEYTVPEDSYFVLGDNRNASKDSRDFTSIGYVDIEYIAGRAIFSLFPLGTV